jgi:hypothetical protein
VLCAALPALLRLVLLFVLLLVLVVVLLPALLLPRAGAILLLLLLLLVVLVVFLVGLVAHGVDRLLDLVLRQAALDGLDELVLRARAELLEQFLFCPLALVVEQLGDLVLLQA